MNPEISQKHARQMLRLCKQFVKRCEMGEIRSNQTYATMKSIIAGVKSEDKKQRLEMSRPQSNTWKGPQ